MCNDDIRNYNSKISDLGYLTLQNKGWCLCRTRGSVYVEHRVVFMWWLGVSYIRDVAKLIRTRRDMAVCQYYGCL